MLPPPRGGEALEAWAVYVSASLLPMLIGSVTDRSAQTGAEKPPDHLRVGLSLGRPDHLADEEPEQARLAIAVLVHLVGVGQQHLIDDRSDGALVADLGQTALADDLLRVAAPKDHLGQHLFRRRARDLARLGGKHQCPESSARQLCLVEGPVAELAGQFVDHPSGGGIW